MGSVGRDRIGLMLGASEDSEACFEPASNPGPCPAFGHVSWDDIMSPRVWPATQTSIYMVHITLVSQSVDIGSD